MWPISRYSNIRLKEPRKTTIYPTWNIRYLDRDSKWTVESQERYRMNQYVLSVRSDCKVLKCLRVQLSRPLNMVFCLQPKNFFNLHSGGWNQGPLDTAAT
jgi:hypothetical protein